MSIKDRISVFLGVLAVILIFMFLQGVRLLIFLVPFCLICYLIYLMIW